MRAKECGHAKTRKTYLYPVAPGYSIKMCRECWGAENKNRREIARYEGFSPAKAKSKWNKIPTWPGS